MKEREISNKRVCRLTRGGLKQRTSFPNPVPSQKGGNCRGRRSRRTRVATRELALRFVLPEHQSTTIPPFLRKARGQKQEGKKKTQRQEISNMATGSQGEAQTENKLPKPHAFAKRGQLQGTAIEKD